MSYEKGDKFVLEIAEIFESGEKKLYRMKDFASLVFDENGLQRLRRIRETDAEQLANARAEGAEEAWRFIQRTDEEESLECQWDMKYEGLVYLRHHTYAEAKADFEKWKAAQKWEPKVGDVVRLRESTIVGVITGFINPLGNYQLWANTGKGYNFSLDELEPTGRHVDIAPILKVLEEVEHE